MAGNPASVSVLALAGCLTYLCFMSATGQARAQSTARAAGYADFQFDIPAQPLAAALDLYAAVSGRPVLFRSALVAGRISFPVAGKYSADAALHVLLEGTGLAVDDVGNAQVDAFILKPAGDAIAPAPASAAPEDMSRYDGQLQARIWNAFCSNPDIRPGNYRALLRFEVDAAGRIGHARLLGSSGDAYRDAELLRTLQQLRVDQPPPDMAQPLTMLILPRDQIAGRPCAAGAP